jgi:hypothetical protein
MEQCIFTLSLIIEGVNEKVSQFIKPQKSIYNKELFYEQKVFFEQDRKVKTKK